MKFLDYFVITMAILAGTAGIIFSINVPRGNSVYISTPEGEYRYSLEKDKIIKVKGLDGEMVFEIKGRKIRAIESNCPHRICVLRGWVYRNGDSIVCIPNHIIAKIETAENDIDAIIE